MSVRPDAPREEGDAGDRGREAELRGRGGGRQRQHRQATRFLHQDSADLLPLDGLKRLGTSKDWQPHNVIQRRLVEGNPSRPHGGASLGADRDPRPGEREEGQQDRKASSSGQLQVPGPGSSGGRGHRHPLQSDLRWMPQPPGVGEEGPRSPGPGGAAGAPAGPGDRGVPSPGGRRGEP